METNVVSIHFEHLLRNCVQATKIGLTFSQLAHGCISTPRGRGVIQRCRLQRHPSMSNLCRRVVRGQRNLGNYDLIRSMSTLFRRVVAGQRDLGNYDLIRSMSTLFRRVVSGQRDLGNYDLIRSMGNLFRRVVAGQRNFGNYDLIRSMGTLFRRVVRGQRDLGNYDLFGLWAPYSAGVPRGGFSQ